jgi:hypothetical protein
MPVTIKIIEKPSFISKLGIFLVFLKKLVFLRIFMIFRVVFLDFHLEKSAYKISKVYCFVELDELYRTM